MSFQPTLVAADRNTGPIWFQELRPASGRGCEPILDTSAGVGFTAGGRRRGERVAEKAAPGGRIG